MGLDDLRDIVIIVYGIVGILLLFVLLALSLLLFFMIRRLSGSITKLVEEPIRPTLEEVQKTAQNIRGASDFVVDRTVHPVIRAMAFARGVRRGVGTLTGLRSRQRK